MIVRNDCPVDGCRDRQDRDSSGLDILISICVQVEGEGAANRYRQKTTIRKRADQWAASVKHLGFSSIGAKCQPGAMEASYRNWGLRVRPTRLADLLVEAPLADEARIPDRRRGRWPTQAASGGRRRHAQSGEQKEDELPHSSWRKATEVTVPEVAPKVRPGCPRGP